MYVLMMLRITLRLTMRGTVTVTAYTLIQFLRSKEENRYIYY